MGVGKCTQAVVAYAGYGVERNLSVPLWKILEIGLTGRSILDEIHAQRFARICDLLANTSWPISTVIAQSGYVSESFAQKLFRSHTGLTMRAWRMRSHAPIP